MFVPVCVHCALRCLLRHLVPHIISYLTAKVWFMHGCIFFFLVGLSARHCWKVCLMEQMFLTLCTRVLHCVQWGWDPSIFFFTLHFMYLFALSSWSPLFETLDVYSKVAANRIATSLNTACVRRTLLMHTLSIGAVKRRSVLAL